MPPTTTARQTPAGIILDDGFSTKIAFEADPDVSLWERTVTPPGVDGGDAIDITTMHNETWRTMSTRSLKTLTDSSFTALYDPAVYEQVIALINVETSVTLHFPDGSTYSFFGALRTFEPDEITEGEPPSATCTITPTNRDPATGAEAAPVLVSVAGT